MKNISKSRPFSIFTLLSLIILLSSCQKNESFDSQEIDGTHSQVIEDDLESMNLDLVIQRTRCERATLDQITYVNLGTSKLDRFLQKCYLETNSKKWCDQIARPNPESHRVFECTYSSAQPHVFVHPEERTWAYAITAVKLVQNLEAKNIKVDMIYNWWRPEPYNGNVGGAAGRHPFGTSVDVRFSSKTEQNKAHAELCKAKKAKIIRALGYYPGTGLHLGVGDKSDNTWGKPCS